ncbi:ankyrin repeat domain-containing protein [Gemmatimonas groenlandica]|uniref:Uncharacterized protein n=1 Tax=Gemmatimonas groenlandica TaxID=2732249 RepID=A0A6M4IVJ1_9BACT|nr:ankyrin repeat domain-containing protein [Gemmatimonas groenlandica]QJR37627.1 hypothetical protein HKW67_19940 [Gemmatimonas groenlandica]
MSMLLSLVLAYFTTATLNGGIDFRADGTAVAPTRFEQFLHGWWLTFFFTSMFFAADHILVHTWTRWRLGRDVIEIGQQAHNPFAILPYAALGGMGLWIIVTVLRLPWAYRAAKGRSRYQWEFLVAAIAAMGMYMVPRSFLHHATLATVGPGAHAGALLSYAAATGDERTVKHLIEHRDALDASNDEGQGALQGAINWNREEIVQLLLDHGAQLPCASWHIRRWNTEVASRRRGRQIIVASTDSLFRIQALRSDSLTAAWAAAFGRVPSPCE